MPAMATSHTSARAFVVLSMLSFAIALLSLAADCSATTRSLLDGCTGPYGWPVKPFDRPHPVRGNFGDPRTRFAEPRSDQALLEGDGVFSFHQGVDINAPDGTPVYPVASGRVTRARGQRVTVTCGNGRSFQYWHVDPAVHRGQAVEVGKTILGSILPMREHVHLTELREGRAVNPLMPGHLTPYRDTTSPRVLGIAVRDEHGADELTGSVHGRVSFLVEAIDTPAMPVQGRWQGGYPVTPALITWRIQGASRVVVPRRVAWDVRSGVPKNEQFWEKYARGTYQNWPVFDSRHFRFERGKYLFKLTVQPFDTRRLADGVHQIVVIAEDTAGNRDIRTLRFVVQNGLSSAETA